MECFIKMKFIILKSRISLVLGFALVTVVVKYAVMVWNKV